MMLPLNLNLQLNATSALWANDSTLEILHKHILKYDQLKYKEERKGKAGSGCSFLGRGASVLGLVVEGEEGRLGLALVMSVYDYTSSSVTELRARQARTRCY
jgi:hypothetical protein